jgi:hypothetical protein
MKKILFLIVVAGAFFTSCEKDEIGGTATQEIAGEWVVTNQQSVDEYYYIFGGQGQMPDEVDIENWEWDFIYDEDYARVLTYNTAANLPTEMFVSDGGSFWDYTVKAKVDGTNFEVPETDNLAYEDCKVTIIKGQILKGAATTPSGVPADSIVYYVKFSDDDYGFTYTKVSGYRHTGFADDEQ